MLIDTHNHLYFDSFDADRYAVLARMVEAGVRGAVVIGIDPPTIRLAHELVVATAAARHADPSAPLPQLAYAAGLHPTSAFDGHINAGPDGPYFDARAYLAEWLSCDTPPVAIGECGIDLHWDTNPLEAQRVVFRAQLELARELDLPAVIHTRSANAETLEVLESVPGTRGVLHCFNGSAELLSFALAPPGWYVSFAGNLTYPKASELHAAARDVPVERLLVETDAPFLAPQPVRGKRCEPAHVAHTARYLAELRGVDYAELEAQLLVNSVACFGEGIEGKGERG